MTKGDSIILVHASDFHMRDYERNPLLSAHDIRQLFIHDVAKLAKKIGSPTALIFSGDIAWSGESVQYDVARHMFTDILNCLSLKEQCILMVPGNHDVVRRKAESLKSRMLRDQLRDYPDQRAEREFAIKGNELLEPLSAFQEFAISYDCLIDKEKGYWEIDNVNNSTASEYLVADFKIQIRGISTVHVSDRNDDQMNGQDKPSDDGSLMYVVRGQLTCPPTEDETPFRILVGHHPPSWWRFSKERKRLANRRFHLHLFGHEHKFAPQLSGNAVCVTAGAINPDDTSKDKARYNWIKITRNDDGYLVRIWSRVFDRNIDEFVEDESWPAGQGYCVSHTLNAEATMIPPDNISTQKLESEISSKKISINEETPAPKSDATLDSDMPDLPSPHSVRFTLLSQGHAKYAEIFKRLGYEPNAIQKNTLGGLEYYQEILKELLTPEKIGSLISAMKEEGVNVN